MRFEPSADTVGVELELQILDAESLDLSSRIADVLAMGLPRAQVQPELFQSTVELVSRPGESVAALERELRPLARALHDRMRAAGLALCGAGTHPFCMHLARITPQPRYRTLQEGARYLAVRQITFALQVHCGMRSGEEAIAVMRRLRRFLPLYAALSASSPFWHGVDTGYASFRQRILASTRSFGLPPDFESWEAFKSFWRMATRSGTFAIYKDVHWDLRPRPDFGTLELRVMDMPSTFGASLALAGLTRALVLFAKRVDEAGWPRCLPGPLPWWIEKENCFRASRDGLDAVVVFDESGELRPLRRVLDDLLVVLEPVAAQSGEAEYLHSLGEHAARPGYERQRLLHAESRSVREVVAGLVEDLDRDLAA